MGINGGYVYIPPLDNSSKMIRINYTTLSIEEFSTGFFFKTLVNSKIIF